MYHSDLLKINCVFYFIRGINRKKETEKKETTY